MALKVVVPESAVELDQVRELMRSFITWHRDRHREDLYLIDCYFDTEAFELELSSLPGKYSPPEGQLLLACLDEQPAGCVALRGIDSETCEMKRMFVYPHLHGNGVGRALGQEIIDEGRRLGYRWMVLDTSIRQNEAQRLYSGFGFEATEPYYEMPREVRDWLVFMRRKL